MTSRDLFQDTATGKLELRESSSYRSAGWAIALFALIVLTFSYRASTPSGCLFFLVFFPAVGLMGYGIYGALKKDAVLVDPHTRTLVHSKTVLFYHPPARILAFSAITGVEIKFGRYHGEQVWVVSAISHAGKPLVINSSEHREQMMQLGQIVATLTGASLLDQPPA